MKILMFINSLGAGGAERSMVDLAKFLHDRKDTVVQIACLKEQEFGFEKEVKDYGIDLKFYADGKGYVSKVNFLKNVIRKEKPDIIHSVLAEANFITRFAFIFFKIKNVKIVQSLVNTPYSEERKNDSNLPWRKFLMAKQVDKWSARLTSNIFYHSITQEVLDHYRPLFNIKNNYRIIYRGRDENKFLNDKKPSTDFSIINVGRQEFAKGQLDILKALVYLKEEKNIGDINLQILGKPGHYSEVLNNFIAENKLENQVEIHGFVNDVEKRLVQADAFIFPSYYEGLGGALIEASAAKLPVACSNIPVLKEVVGSEEGALFCAPGDYEQLGENIYKLYKDENLRKELGKCSYNRFQEMFKLKTINEQMYEMYMQLVKNE